MFSFLKRTTPESLALAFGREITNIAAEFRSFIPESISSKSAASAGAEVGFLLLHILDRKAFKVLGPDRRNTLVDQAVFSFNYNYAKDVLNDKAPEEFIVKYTASLANLHYARGRVYEGCKNFISDNPDCLLELGTLCGVVWYYISLALDDETPLLEKGILLGINKTEYSNYHEGAIFGITVVIPFLIKAYKTLNMEKRLSKLV